MNDELCAWELSHVILLDNGWSGLHYTWWWHPLRALSGLLVSGSVNSGNTAQGLFSINGWDPAQPLIEDRGLFQYKYRLSWCGDLHYKDRQSWDSLLNNGNPQTGKIASFRDHFVNAPSQWEMTLHYSVISHWLGAFLEWSLIFILRWAPGRFTAQQANDVELWWLAVDIDTMKPEQNGCRFADGTFRCIFLKEKLWSCIQISSLFLGTHHWTGNVAILMKFLHQWLHW